MIVRNRLLTALLLLSQAFAAVEKTDSNTAEATKAYLRQASHLRPVETTDKQQQQPQQQQQEKSNNDKPKEKKNRLLMQNEFKSMTAAVNLNKFALVTETAFDGLLTAGVGFLNNFKNELLSSSIKLGDPDLIEFELLAFIGDLQIVGLEERQLTLESEEMPFESVNQVRFGATYDNLRAFWDELGLVAKLTANGESLNCGISFASTLEFPSLHLGLDTAVADQNIEIRPLQAALGQDVQLTINPAYNINENICQQVANDYILPAFASVGQDLLQQAVAYTGQALNEALESVAGASNFRVPDVAPIAVGPGNLALDPGVDVFMAPAGSTTLSTSGGTSIKAEITQGSRAGGTFTPSSLGPNVVQVEPELGDNLLGMNFFATQFNNIAYSTFYLAWADITKNNAGAPNPSTFEAACAFASLGDGTSESCAVPPLLSSDGFFTVPWFINSLLFITNGFYSAFHTTLAIKPPQLQFNTLKNSIEGALDAMLHMEGTGILSGELTDLADIVVPLRAGAFLPNYNAESGTFTPMQFYVTLEDDFVINLDNSLMPQQLLDNARNAINDLTTDLLSGLNAGLQLAADLAPPLKVPLLENFPTIGQSTQLELDLTLQAHDAVTLDDGTIQDAYMAFVGDANLVVQETAQTEGAWSAQSVEKLSTIESALAGQVTKFTDGASENTLVQTWSKSPAGENTNVYKVNDRRQLQEQAADGSWIPARHL